MLHQLLWWLVNLYFTVCIAQKEDNKDAYWKDDRNTIVHLFEWKWNDIAEECERFLQYKGFAGVQVSPVTENAVVDGRPWWERYQPVSYKLSTRSGNESEFQDMVRRCNKVGVRIYVDVILNHMATNNDKEIIGTAGTTADSRQLNYSGVPYGRLDFHHSCSIQNYNDADQVRDCEISGLKDLNQGKYWVREKMLELLNHLTDVGVAGFRIGAAKHMKPSDLLVIYDRLTDLKVEFNFPNGSKPYIYQEVIDLGGEAVSKSEYIDLGVVTEYKHSTEIGRVFLGKDKLKYLINWGPGWGLLQSNNALVFVDNHDFERGKDSNVLTHKNPKRYKMAIAFMLAHTYGTPAILSSYTFDDPNQGPPQDNNQNIVSPVINPDDTCGNGWVCEHRWRQIYNMVGFKNAVKGTEVTNFWTNGDQQIAFCRGNKGFIAFNNLGDLKQEIKTCLPPGTYCDVISGNLFEHACSGKNITVAQDGVAYIELLQNDYDGVIAIHINSKL